MSRRITAFALVVVAGCAPDPPDTIEAARAVLEPVVVDVWLEARAFNGGRVFEFVADENGYVSIPTSIPAGEVMITLTYVGDEPAPHSVVFTGLNSNQPITAVDLPGSNNGVVRIPADGPIEFFDGAPGNRELGYEGTLAVQGMSAAAPPSTPVAVASWTTAGLEFTTAPDRILPAGEPIVLELTVGDAQPHSVAFEGVRDGVPLVAVDGPGGNQRTVNLPPGSYIYFCAVPGHREAGMEGLVTLD